MPRRPMAHRSGIDRPGFTSAGSTVKRRRGYLPRIETVVDIDDGTCPCCHGELHRIGEDGSERLDIEPSQFRVLVTRRPRYP